MKNPNPLRHSLTKLPCLFLASLLMINSALRIHAQSRETAESLEAAFKADKSMRLSELIQDPDQVDSGVEGESIEFHLLSSVPTKSTYYVEEGGDYLAIRAAYNSFGPKHRLSKRGSLVLNVRMIVKEKDGEEKQVYTPAFTVSLASASQPFAVIMPNDSDKNRGTPEKPQPLELVNLSPRELPYDKLVFRNTLDFPLTVRTDKKSGVIQPRSSTLIDLQRYSSEINFVDLNIGFTKNGHKPTGHETRVIIFKGGRGVVIPIADPWGSGGVSFVVYRLYGAS